MKIISWNVAGLRACLNKGFDQFFDKEKADIYCLQETKVLEEQNPFHPYGYHEYLYPAEKKGYSGTMIYSKEKPISVKYGIGEEEYDNEGRIITAEYNDFYLVNCYVPNSKRELERLDSRMHFEELMKNYLKDLSSKKNVIYCGDLNVAHEEIDIKNPKANRRSAGFTDEERNKMTELLDSGFIDTFRYFYPEEIKYSWWSYLGHAREKGIGWRLDYFIVNKEMIKKIKDSTILDDVEGSDHCPIKLEI
ncbi:MAG: exodeoxyribonuclease III [Bacilli bacterium]|nr:exodeoxyribonuclease III [Bacilli bacterium]MBR6137470.1 exodeoxyribonuclease III [Bacilli bacterium]